MKPSERISRWLIAARLLVEIHQKASQQRAQKLAGGVPEAISGHQPSTAKVCTK
jgi:hypothetical protein